MRRDTFGKAIEKYQKDVAKSLKGDRDTIADVMQDTITRLLDKKAYQDIEHDIIDDEVFLFLKQAARYTLHDTLRTQEIADGVFVSLVTDDGASVPEENESDSAFCPFCHIGILNEYQACANCHTIIGQGKSHRERVNVSDNDLGSLPNYEISIDVQTALEKLTPLERAVIEASVNDYATLDDLACAHGLSPATLCRTYARAKHKLQDALLDYA